MTKKITLLLSVILLTVVTLTSCKKESYEPEFLEQGNFKMVFGASSMASKADQTTAAKAWEKKLVSVTMFVYEGEKVTANETAVPVYTHVFSAAEISKMQSIFSIPNIQAGAKYEFYVVANKDYGDEAARMQVTRKALYEEEELLSTGSNPTVNKYNDADYTNMTDEAKAATKYAEGFLMTGMKLATSPAVGDNKPTTVEVSLTRPVAKVEVNSKISQKFIDKYGKGASNSALGGTLKITKVEIVDVPKEGLIFQPATMPTFTSADHLTDIDQTNATTFEQTTENDQTNKHNNLFYFYANQIGNADNPYKQPELRIYAEYTFDGGNHTTNITYKRPLGGEGTVADENNDTGKGVFLRNAIYVVNATINGLTPEEVVATIKITDWATATTQNIGFGGE